MTDMIQVPKALFRQPLITSDIAVYVKMCEICADSSKWSAVSYAKIGISMNLKTATVRDAISRLVKNNLVDQKCVASSGLLAYKLRDLANHTQIPQE